MFEALLLAIVIMLSIVVFFGYLNEKTIQLPTEVGLLLAGLLISVIVLVLQKAGVLEEVGDAVPRFLLNDFLINGVLCFMLFAGSCKLRFRDLKPQMKLVSCLALVSTIISALFYGILSFGIAKLLGLDSLGFSQCLLLGCIISPTDPIAAMSILKKVGLPEDVALAIEGESLFNDGVGVALFVVVSGILKGDSTVHGLGGFVLLLGKELLGAIGVGVVISFLLYQLFVRTKDVYRQLFISLLAVSASYVICERIGCSSAIAAVVCGICFATFMDKPERENPEEFLIYRNFWSVADALLNSILYVLLGLTFINICRYTKHHVPWILIAIICNVVSRYVGVFASAKMIRQKPQNYKAVPFTNLLTWAGLKGALCLALAMQTSAFLPPEAFNTLLVCTFAVSMFTTLGQGLTIGKFYEKFYTKKDA